VHFRDYSGKKDANQGSGKKDANQKVVFAAEQETPGKKDKEEEEPEVKVNRALMSFVRDYSLLV
jgi:hypothetical protein